MSIRSFRAVIINIGNAKTIRNDNSSRFGKFMQVCFDSKWCIRGCIIQDYLLEQSRITFQSIGERNYHVLYQLVAEGQRNAELANTLYLRDPSFYRYLNGGATANNTNEIVPIDIQSEANRFEALRLAFTVLQISETIIDGILKVLSAILWLGNLNFADVDGERCELADGDGEIVKIVAELVGIQEAELIQVALKRQINVRGNITEIPLKVQEARENRNAVSGSTFELRIMRRPRFIGRPIDFHGIQRLSAYVFFFFFFLGTARCAFRWRKRCIHVHSHGSSTTSTHASIRVWILQSFWVFWIFSASKISQ